MTLKWQCHCDQPSETTCGGSRRWWRRCDAWSSEQRDAAEVASDLINSACDLVRIRILSTPNHGGSLPLDDAAIFVEMASELMVAAVSSVMSPEPFHSAPWPAQVNDFVWRVQFGALQRGSFAISVPSLPKTSQ